MVFQYLASVYILKERLIFKKYIPMAFITYEDYLKVAELTRLALMFYVFQNKVKWSLSIIKLKNAKLIYFKVYLKYSKMTTW